MKHLNLTGALFVVCLAVTLTGHAADRPIIDAHIHYSHDARDLLPPEKAIAILRQAGLKRAMVSSSSDDGTQALYKIDPELIAPVLRPYRKRGETGTWMHDETVIDMLSDRLKRYTYYGIGEFHAFGDDIDLPVLQATIKLAKEYGLFLHAHSDADAVERIFATNPDALVLWAHSGFDDPDDVGKMLAKHPNLWSDLAFRSEHAYSGNVDADWAALFKRFPERFMVGTDSYTPERWFYVIDHANWSRGWLSTLPEELAENIAWRNADRLLQRVRP